MEVAEPEMVKILEELKKKQLELKQQVRCCSGMGLENRYHSTQVVQACALICVLVYSGCHQMQRFCIPVEQLIDLVIRQQSILISSYYACWHLKLTMEGIITP